MRVCCNLCRVHIKASHVAMPDVKSVSKLHCRLKYEFGPSSTTALQKIYISLLCILFEKPSQNFGIHTQNPLVFPLFFLCLF